MKSTWLSLLTFSFPLAIGACTAADDTTAPTDDPVEVVAARAHLAAIAPEIASSDLEVTRDKLDDLGMTHVRQQQLVDGIPVIGGEAIVHLGPDGALRSISDNLVRGLHVDTTPAITSADAIDRALAASVGAGRETATPTSDLRILRDKDGDHLIWQVAIESLPADDVDHWSKPMVMVDAHSGAVLHSVERIEDAVVNATGTAKYAGTVSIRNWQDATGFWLEDDLRKVGAYSLEHGQPGDTVFHYKHDTGTWGNSYPTAVQAQWALQRTYDYYHGTFSREGIDGNYGPGYVNGLDGGGKLVSGLVSWGTATNNAKWIDPFMVFGDGDGTTFSQLVSLDVVAHEWTHGVTSREANLDGLNETPALNEHLSDVFGAAAEAYNDGGASTNTFLIGEQVYTPGIAGDALRYMGDPAKDGRSLDTWSSSLDSADGHDGAGRRKPRLLPDRQRRLAPAARELPRHRRRSRQRTARLVPRAHAVHDEQRELRAAAQGHVARGGRSVRRRRRDVSRARQRVGSGRHPRHPRVRLRERALQQQHQPGHRADPAERDGLLVERPGLRLPRSPAAERLRPRAVEAGSVVGRVEQGVVCDRSGQQRGGVVLGHVGAVPLGRARDRRLGPVRPRLEMTRGAAISCRSPARSSRRCR
jgi:Zn-dependent metalloprotease